MYGGAGRGSRRPRAKNIYIGTLIELGGGSTRPGVLEGEGGVTLAPVRAGILILGGSWSRTVTVDTRGTGVRGVCALETSPVDGLIHTCAGRCFLRSLLEVRMDWVMAPGR